MPASDSPSQLATQKSPSFAREVLTLYARSLPEVRFPGLDLAALQEAARELEDARGDAEACAAAVRAAEAEVVARESSLTALAERALAYARIYAAGDAELSTQLAAITHKPVPDAAEANTARKRGRPRKSHSAAELFGTLEAAETTGTADAADAADTDDTHANAAE